MSVVDKIRLRSTSAKDSNNVVISEDGLLVIFLSKCAHIYYPIYSDGSFYMTKTIEYDWSLSDSIIDDRVTTIYKSGVKRTMQDLLVNSNISYDMNSIIRSCTWTLSSLYNGSLSLLTILTRNGCCLMIDSNSNSNSTNEYKTMDLIIKPHDVSIVYDFSKAFNDNKSNKTTSTATTTKDNDFITCIKFFPFFEKTLTFSHSKQLLAVVGSNGKISLWKLSKNDDFPQLNGDILTCYEFAIPDVNDNVTSIIVIEQTQLIPNVYALILCGTSKGQLLMLHVFKDVSNEYQLHVVWKHELHSSIFDITVGNDDEIFVAGDAGKIFVCNISNSMILCVDDMHSNIITGLKTIGCYRGQVNNRNKLQSSIISSSFDGMIKCWDYSNTLPYTRNMLASNNLNKDMYIVSKRTEIKVSNLVQGVSCDPWGIIVAYSEVEPATHFTSRKQHLAKQKHGGTAVTMITNPILTSDWCINIEEWIKVFHSMLSNSNANRLGLIPLSIAISKNLQIYYQGYHINLNSKGGSTYKEELIDNESSDSDDSDDYNAGKQHSNPSSNDPLIQKQHKIDTMKLLVENVVTNKLDHHLNNTNIIGNIDDEEICHAQLLGLPSDATTEIIDKKLLLWKTLNHVVQVGEKLHGLRDIYSLSLAKQLRVQILVQNAIMNVDKLHKIMQTMNATMKLSDIEAKSLQHHYELLQHHRKEQSCKLLKPYLNSTIIKDRCCICSKEVSFNANNPFNSSCDSCGVVHERCCLTMNITDIEIDTAAKCPLCKCVIIQSNDNNIAVFIWLSNTKNSLCPFCLVPTLSI